MRKIGVIGRFQQPNKYTLASLVSILETSSIPLDPEINMSFIIRKETPYEILRKIRSTSFDKIIVLLPVLSTQIRYIKEETIRLNEIKTQVSPQTILIAGGPHATFYPEDLLNLGIDYIIRGEAEEALPHLIKAIAHDNMEWRKIPGLCYKEGNSIVKNPIAVINSLDPFPTFSLKNRLFSPLEITRGCPFGCYFCSVSSLFGSNVRHRSIESICKWLEMAAKLNYNRVWFISPNSFGYGSQDGRSLNSLIVQQMLKRVTAIPKLEQVFFGTFPSEVRPDFVTAELLDSISPYIANKSFTLGAQSASNAMLTRIHRQHTFERVLEAIDLMRSRNFQVDVDFIFGLPGENEEDKEENLAFFRYVLKTSGIRIHGHTFLPLPGSHFQNASPGMITDEYKNILGRLALKKKAFGSFLIQENRALELSRMRQR